MKTYSDIITVCSRDQKIPSQGAVWEKPSRRKKYSEATLLSGLHEVSGAGGKEGNGSRWAKTVRILWLFTGRTKAAANSTGGTALSARDMHLWSCKRICNHWAILLPQKQIESLLCNACTELLPNFRLQEDQSLLGHHSPSQLCWQEPSDKEHHRHHRLDTLRNLRVSERWCDTKLHFPAWSRAEHTGFAHTAEEPRGPFLGPVSSGDTNTGSWKPGTRWARILRMCTKSWQEKREKWRVLKHNFSSCLLKAL